MGCSTGSDVIFMGGAPGAPGINAYADPASTYITVNNASSTSSDWTGDTAAQSIQLHAPGAIYLNGSATDNGGSKIVNMAAGTISSTSMDAVNGSQLFGLANSTASAIGGGSTVNADGTISAPAYAVGGQTFSNAGDALTNIDGRTTANTSAISNLQGQMADAVLYDSAAHGSVTLGGVGASVAVALHNVAAGAVNASSFDAVNGSQLYSVASSTASAIGGGSTVNSNGSISAPTYAVGGQTFNNAGAALTNIDGRVTQNSSDITNLQGDITNLSGQMADAVQYDSSAHGSVTLGGVGASVAVALHNVAAGAVNASSFDAVNGSQLYNVASSTASAIGGGSTVNSDGSISAPAYAVGGQTFNNAGAAFTNIDGRVTQNSSDITNLQGDITNLSGQMADAVQYDSSAHDSVTLGGVGATVAVALHNVAAGAVNASSFDAVNGSQLYGVASSTASAIGGGSTVNSDGSISAPTYAVGGQTFNNAGAAFTNIDGRVNDITNELNNGTIGLVQQDAVTKNITVASATGGSIVDFTGTDGTRKLTGVSAGTLSATSTDAVNGAQLYATNQQVAQNTSDIAGLQTSVTNMQGQMANSVSYDSSAHDSLTLGGAGATTAVTIHNVAAGTADGDAVNVGQMNDAISAVSQQAASAANPLVAANGDRNTEAAIASGAHATAIGANASAGANNSVALGAGSVADRENTVSVGSAGNERQITNVAAGTAGTDAVNVDQLNAATANSQGYVDSRVAGMQSQIDDAKKSAFGAAAAAMAVAGLPQPTEPGKTMVAAGASHIGGQTGMALGVSYVTRNNKWVGKLAASSSSQGNTGVTVGAGYQW